MRKLSIILHGRNDDYQVDWLDRFEFCLNFNINTLKKNKLDEFVEIVIVDYGSEVRIRDTVTILESKCNLSFLNVTLSYGAESDYHVTRALNIGLDNSTSKFCLITSADFIMASHAWSALINKIDTNHQADYYPYLLIPRKQPLFLSEYQKFSFTELDSLFHRINNDKIPYLSLKPAVGGGAGAMVVERSLLARVGFFDEAWGGHGFNDMEIASKLFEFTEYEDTSLAGIWGYKLPYTLGSRNLQIGSSPYKDLQNERNKKYGVVDNIEAFSTPLKTIGREVEGITVDTNEVRCLSSNKNITASIISSLRFGERISSLNYWRVTAGLLSAVPISPDLTYLVSIHTYKYLVPILGSTNQTPNNIVLFSRIKLYDDLNISQWVQRMYSRGYVGFVNYIYGDIFDFQSLKKINPSRSVCILSLEDYKQLKLQDGENLFSHLSPLVSFVLCNKKDLPCLPENYYSFSVNAEVTALIHSEEVYNLGDRSVIAPKLVLMSIGLSGILFIHRYAAGLGRRIRKFILG